MRAGVRQARFGRRAIAPRRLTQRVAFRIGDSENVVVESGLHNLAQEQAPVLVNFGADKVEQYLLVRPKQSDEGSESRP